MTTTDGRDDRDAAAVSGARRALAGLRVRLVGGYLLLLFLALTASIVAIRAVLLERVDARIERELLQEVEELRTLADGRDPVTGQPFGNRVDRVVEVFLRRNIPHRHETMIAFVDGEPFLRSVRPPPLRLDLQPDLVAMWSGLQAADRGQLATEVGPVDYLAVPLRADGAVRGVFVAAVFTALERAEVDEVVRIAGMVGVFTLAAGSLLAFALAGRVLQPVRQLTATAQRISDTDLSRRIGVRGHDELAQLAAVDVRALAEEVFAKAQGLASRSWRLEAMGQGQIVGDRHRLTQALVALASNAVSYTDEDVEVAIGTAVSDGHARMWVRDEGPGIPPRSRSGFSTASPAARTGSAAATAADSGWRSCAPWQKRTGGAWNSAAARAPAPRSPSSCPSSGSATRSSHEPNPHSRGRGANRVVPGEGAASKWHRHLRGRQRCRGPAAGPQRRVRPGHP